MSDSNKYFSQIKAYIMGELSFEEEIAFLTEVALCPELEEALERASNFKDELMAEMGLASDPSEMESNIIFSKLDDTSNPPMPPITYPKNLTDRCRAEREHDKSGLSHLFCLHQYYKEQESPLTESSKNGVGKRFKTIIKKISLLLAQKDSNRYSLICNFPKSTLMNATTILSTVLACCCFFIWRAKPQCVDTLMLTFSPFGASQQLSEPNPYLKREREKTIQTLFNLNTPEFLRCLEGLPVGADIKQDRVKGKLSNSYAMKGSKYAQMNLQSFAEKMLNEYPIQDSIKDNSIDYQSVTNELYSLQDTVQSKVEHPTLDTVEQLYRQNTLSLILLDTMEAKQFRISTLPDIRKLDLSHIGVLNRNKASQQPELLLKKLLPNSLKLHHSEDFNCSGRVRRMDTKPAIPILKGANFLKNNEVVVPEICSSEEYSFIKD